MRLKVQIGLIVIGKEIVCRKKQARSLLSEIGLLIRLRFIKDTTTSVTTRISIDSAGNQATGGGSYVRALSADGRDALFESLSSNLVAGDTNGQLDAFLRDLTKTGVQQLSRVVISNKVSAK